MCVSMSRSLFAILIIGTATSAGADAPDFDRQVAPILAGRCLECHSGAEPKGKLDLSRAKSALAGGESGAAIEAGKPEASNLWQRIAANEMPPKHPLPPAEREILKTWIASGAKWGADPIDAFRYTSSTRAGYDWWSLQPLAITPQIPNPQSPIPNPIDGYIRSKLTESKLTPSAPADRRTLLRRVYFDLTGLPPTPEEAEAFLSVAPSLPLSVSPSGQDGEKERQREGERASYLVVVDRLLASPHYGERWARHWLDVAHFGESDGFEFDKMRPHAWRYRDWVIDALNRDLPYDEFARLQIAGDVLPPANPSAVIATGFLAGGAYDSLMPKGETMRQVMRHDELEDLVALVSQSFLGLTVNCARCHDHKFDPIRQTDYYRLAAALAGVKRGNRDVSVRPPAELVTLHAAAEKELQGISAAARDSVLAKREAAAGKRPQPPQALARWEFDGDLRDSAGSLHGVAYGGAKVENGALLLDGKQAFVAMQPLTADVTAKTLEVWVQLADLNQRGGGAITLQTPDGATFDSIVFGEREPRRWISGSDFFARTKSIEKAADEKEAGERIVHLVAVYEADGTIRLYRDGLAYGEPYKPDSPVVKFAAGKSQIVFGLRHSPPGGNKFLAGKIDRAALYDRALSAAEVAASAGATGRTVIEEEIVADLNDAARRRYAELKAEVTRLTSGLALYRDRQAYSVTPQAAPVMHRLVRGNVEQPAEPIAASGIACLTTSGPEFGLPPDASDKDRRARLAEWIGSEKNPLFARTIVNRLWQHHFGRGLVETPSDLGFSGGRASHPELLDYLARELIASRWSLKAIHRLIVTSETYQQSSRPREDCLAADADNRLLWRYSPRRLEAEAVRDAMLSVSGLLNPERGGPSFQDFRPYIYKTVQYYEPLDPTGPEFHRRSIYRFWARGGKNPLLDSFDCPDPSTATPKRPTTTTPLQALALLNNSFTLRMADALASRLCREAPDSERQQIRRAFELTYGRPPADDELTSSSVFVNQCGLAAFCRVLLNANGFLYVH